MLIVSRYSGDPKGFGCVTFDSFDGAKAGFEAMRGQEIAGLPINLDYAASKYHAASQPLDGSSAAANPILQQGDSGSERHNYLPRTSLLTVQYQKQSLQ